MSYLPEITRQLPQSVDAEKGVLGSILLSPEKTLGLCARLGVDETYFHHPAHSRIYGILDEMREAGKPIDLISLTQLLEDRHILDEVGGAAAVTELFTFVPTASNVGYYLEILREKKILRSLILACTEYGSRSYEEQGEPETLVIEADAAFTKIRESLQKTTDVTRQSLLDEYLEEKEKIAKNEVVREVLSSPLKTITEKVGGYALGEITIIMGPTNSGKSLLGMEHVILGCLEKNYPSAVFTGEMPYRQYMDRIACNHARVPSRCMRYAKMEFGENRRFMQTQALLLKAPLEIFDQKRNKLSLESIESEIRYLKKTMGLRLVLIDYLQRLNITRRKDVRRDEELGYASTLFKGLAVELDLWVFLISSTNDDGQVRDSRGPEYDADNIISVITDKNKVTQKVFIPKWRDGEKSYSIDVEVIGEFCQFREKEFATREKP